MINSVKTQIKREVEKKKTSECTSDRRCGLVVVGQVFEPSVRQRQVVEQPVRQGQVVRASVRRVLGAWGGEGLGGTITTTKRNRCYDMTFYCGLQNSKTFSILCKLRISLG